MLLNCNAKYILRAFVLGFFKAASLSLLERNLQVRRQMYESKQRQIPIYQVPTPFLSLAAERLLVDRQMLHRDTLCNCFSASISAEEKNAELIGEMEGPRNLCNSEQRLTGVLVTLRLPLPHLYSRNFSCQVLGNVLD